MARRRSRSRRIRRAKLKVLDRVLLAGSVGGIVYLVVLHGLRAPGWAAVFTGTLAGGIGLGQMMRLPRLRSPIVWRRGSR